MSSIQTRFAGQVDHEKAKDGFRMKLLEGRYGKDMGGRNATDAMGSFLDTKHMDAYVASLTENIGPKFFYDSKRIDKKKIEKHPYFDPQVGDMVFPDADGFVRRVNEQWLQRELEVENAIEDKVDRIMKYAIANDRMCMDILNLNDEEYYALLGPGGGADVGLKDPDMLKIDGTVGSIKRTPAGSISQTEKLSKLRFVCKELRYRVAFQNVHRHLEDATTASVGVAPGDVSKVATLATTSAGNPMLA